MNVDLISGPDGSQTIQYYCLPRKESTEVVVAKCTVTGTWNPDPGSVNCSVTQYEVEGNAVPSSKSTGDSIHVSN